MVKSNIASKLHKYKCSEYIVCNKSMIEIDKINANQVYTITKYISCFYSSNEF